MDSNSVGHPAVRFKMFGLQRTATNLVRLGLLKNFTVESHESGREWKHGKIGGSAGDGLSIVVCVRNPFAWLDAMFRFSRAENDRDACKSFDKTCSFDTFCKRPHYGWTTPMHRWNEMNRHYFEWVSSHPAQGIIVRSESLLGLTEQAREFNRVGEHFRWTRQRESIFVFDRKIRHCPPLLGAAMDWDYYGQGRYMQCYDKALLRFVENEIDFELAATLLYPSPSS